VVRGPRAVALCLLSCTMVAGCVAAPPNETGVKVLGFSSSPDHLWLRGELDGKTEFVTYNWTPDVGTWRVEWRGHLTEGELGISLTGADHDVKWQRRFTRLSEPVILADVQAKGPVGVGQWDLDVLYAGVHGEFSLEAWRLPEV